MIVFNADSRNKVKEKVEAWAASQNPGLILSNREASTYHLFDILSENAHALISYLRNDSELAFSHFVDLTAVDYSEHPENHPRRFAVVITLMSPLLGVRVQLKAFVNADKPEIPTSSDLFAGANWCEREVFDLYGIVFTGHPNLKRILLPEDYEGHPLRKDYPLMGNGERANFTVYQGIRS